MHIMGGKILSKGIHDAVRKAITHGVKEIHFLELGVYKYGSEMCLVTNDYDSNTL